MEVINIHFIYKLMLLEFFFLYKKEYGAQTFCLSHWSCSRSLTLTLLVAVKWLPVSLSHWRQHCLLLPCPSHHCIATCPPCHHAISLVKLPSLSLASRFSFSLYCSLHTFSVSPTLALPTVSMFFLNIFTCFWNYLLWVYLDFGWARSWAPCLWICVKEKERNILVLYFLFKAPHILLCHVW